MNLEPVIIYRVMWFRKKKQVSYLFYITYISHIYLFHIYITHIWNIEKWYYLQGKKRDTDKEDRLMDPVVEGEGGTNWEHGAETYRLPRVKRQLMGICCMMQGAQPGALRQPRGVGWGGRGGRLLREGTWYTWPLEMGLAKSTASNWATRAIVTCLCADGTNPVLLQLPTCNTRWGTSGWMRHSVLQGIWWSRSLLDSWIFSGTDFRIPICTPLPI